MQIKKLTLETELTLFVYDQYKRGCRHFAFDFETTGLERTDTIISGAITGDGEEVAFFGPQHVRELAMLPKDITLTAHNLPFDLKMAAWAGHPIHGLYKCTDTMILAHLLDENQDLSLGDLVLKHFQDNYKKEFWSKYKKATDAPEAELEEYNAKDVVYTWKLAHLFDELLYNDGIPLSLIEHVHATQMSMLDTMIRGLRIDKPYLIEKAVFLKQQIDENYELMVQSAKDEVELVELEKWEKDINAYKTQERRAKVPRPKFNPSSTPQLIDILYNRLGLPKQIQKKFSKKHGKKVESLTTDSDALEILSLAHDFPKHLLAWRQSHTVYSTFINGILEREVEGRVYPSFNVCGAVTGRLSHQNPNMANMPSSGGVRGIFVPDPGEVWVSSDFASLEVYVEAHFTQDKNLMRLIHEGISKHDLTANEIKEPRSVSKTVNFLAQYHGTAHKLGKVLGKSFYEAQAILDKYWKAYSGCKALKKQTDQWVDEGTPIVNPFGRKRRFPVKTEKRKEWDGDYRQAYNALIQGTGSDCTSRAMWMTDRELKEKGIGRVLFSVHDEIIIAAKKDCATQAQEILTRNMVEAGRYAKLSVDLKSESCTMETRWEE